MRRVLTAMVAGLGLTGGLILSPSPARPRRRRHDLYYGTNTW